MGAEARSFEQAPVIIRYAPLDAGEDALTLTFHSNDPEAPVAVATITGAAEDNAPPTAVAIELFTGEVDAEGVAGTPVFIDGRGSSDPEGDPLQYSWTLVTPGSSSSTLDTDGAGIVSFTPDLASLYRVDLVVHDSLGAQSGLASTTVTAAGDDELWAHYWNAGSAGIADVSASVTLFDASFPAFEGSAAPADTCDAWHIGTVSFPAGTFAAAMVPVAPVCPAP